LVATKNHLGDVVEESDGDLMGDGVNIAAGISDADFAAQCGALESEFPLIKAHVEAPIEDWIANKPRTAAPISFA
jgi:hypothetical protein